MTKLSLALSAGLIAGANAFWRMECPGRVGLARMDPIVNPGSVSNHVHAIHGSSGEYDVVVNRPFVLFLAPMAPCTPPNGAPASSATPAVACT